MRDPDERAASVALRNGGPAAVRRAIGWYRTHDRRHCGGPIPMAAGRPTPYRADTAAGKDALLLCDTTEMADALNQRLHHDIIAADAFTIAGARGHRIAVGDLILSRRNAATITVYGAEDDGATADPVRNGNRWQVAGIDTATKRIAARRLSDGARAAFEAEYVRQPTSHRYPIPGTSRQPP